MFPKQQQMNAVKLRVEYQRGFGLPLALFIIVVLSLLAITVYRVTAVGNLSIAQEVLSARAFLAADSGAQAMMMRVFPVTGAGTCSAQSITFSNAGLANCTAQVTCTSRLAGGLTVYDIGSSGSCIVGNTIATRSIDVQAHTP